MKLFTDQRGQTTILIALSITCLCGMAGLAVDVGSMFHAKRILQTAADAGAIAGAMEMNYGTTTASARAATAQNGITDGVNGATVIVNGPSQGGPSSGPHYHKTAFVEVIVSQSAPTFFMKLFHLTAMTVSARAVSGLGPTTGCIYTLDPSGIDIGLTGTGDLNMPDCGIVVNSASGNAINMTGSSTITAQSIGIVGSYNAGSNTTLMPTPITGIAPTPDPLAFIPAPTFAASDCLADPHITGSGAHTLGPSIANGTVCYNGLSVTGSGALTLQPGLYIINGGFSSSGTATITGSGGVTLYLAPPNGSLSLTGSGALNLTAPKDGPYSGIVVFEDASDTNAMKVSGSGSSNIQGIFYAPSASLTVTGSSGAAIYADFVVSALSMTGTSNFYNYAGVNGSSPLTSARLVE